MKEIVKLLFYDIKGNVDDNVDSSFVGVVIINLLVWYFAIMIIAPLRVYIYDYLYSFTFLRNIYDLKIAILIYLFIVITTISFQITIVLDKKFKKIDAEFKRKQCEFNEFDNVLTNIDEGNIDMTVDELEDLLESIDTLSLEQECLSFNTILHSKMYKISFMMITILIVGSIIFFDLANKDGESFSVLGRYTLKLNDFGIKLMIVIHVASFLLMFILNKINAEKHKLLSKIVMFGIGIMDRRFEGVKVLLSSISSRCSVDDI